MVGSIQVFLRLMAIQDLKFYLVDTKVTPIWNTMAAIPGHITDEVVLIGNHRDGEYER